MSNSNHVTVESALEVKTVGVVVSNHVVAVNWGVVQERVGTEEDVLRCPHKFTVSHRPWAWPLAHKVLQALLP